MKILNIEVQGYRTLENLAVDFTGTYSTICGKNDSGKTNTIRVLQIIFEGPNNYRPWRRETDINFKTDFTKWKDDDQQNREITIKSTIEVEKDRDAGLFEFITTYLALETKSSALKIRLFLRYDEKLIVPDVQVEIRGTKYESLKAQEILKKIRSSNCFLMHNSTEPDIPFYYPRSTSYLSREFSPEYGRLMDSVTESINKNLEDIAKEQQKEISQLLGRLQDKYSIRMALEGFNLDYIPVDITLGERGHNIPLADWGSGTQNRTRILLTLLRAKQISESVISASKVTPVMVIEEPESFLHPSAQAEFGRVLQDISEEFNVQVIVTSHSPYMLSMSKPDANILLERKVENETSLATCRVITSGENWMEPFSLALGIDSTEFSAWKQLFFNESTSILLVEGETDKKYFELLCNDKHGENQLIFDGEIFPYGGSGSLRNTVLLRFINNRYKKTFITYDLDVENQVVETLNSLGFEKGKDYLGIGLDEPGNKNIEALVPDEIKQKVYAENSELVGLLMSRDNIHRNSAKGKLKSLLLDEFISVATPGDPQYYGAFYPLVAKLNSVFATCE